MTKSSQLFTKKFFSSKKERNFFDDKTSKGNLFSKDKFFSGSTKVQLDHIAKISIGNQELFTKLRKEILAK